MASIGEGVATNLVQRLLDAATTELNYLCCFNTHVQNFEKRRDLLVAKTETVRKDIDDARKRNETQVEKEVEDWLYETNGVIAENTETNKKCFHGWCPDCIWRYKQGKKLAKKIPDITDLIARSDFNRVARLAPTPGIEYYSPQNFIDFDSRMSKFKELVDELQDGNNYIIGLQGLGGTGKTTLAKKVGKQVEDSKAFQKVVFTVVSNPPDISKIRRNIAIQLELPLEEGKEEENSRKLWKRIVDNEGKLLIILDDIWEELDLTDIGIPYGPSHNNCFVLITTRDSRVCEEMGCQQTIKLGTLSDEDALNLFIHQVGKRSDDSSSCEFRDLAGGISKECGGIPLAIVAVATTLKGWPLSGWKIALKTLQKSEPLRNVHDKLIEKVYRSLQLSYDHLKEKAQHILLLCSLFPEDYELPLDLLSKFAIGLGIFGGVNSYFERRREIMIPIKHDLIKSSLLLEGKKNSVKMHDLVREVVLWIANENVQVIMNSSDVEFKSNSQFLFWSNDDFPNCLEAPKLEILIVWIKGEAKVRDATSFEGMSNLKVLFLGGPDSYMISKRLCFTPSSLQSLLSLKNNIRTLIFHKWKLGDIRVLKGLACLETFELEYCSITELPKEISGLKKLKSLGLRHCRIERNNPFKVIERCSQLKELCFVVNRCCRTNEVAEEICPPCPKLQRYSIACSGFHYLFVDGGLLNCFSTEDAGELISKPMFKDLNVRAEVLEFRETEAEQWKSLVDEGMMKDLIKLCLSDLADTYMPLTSSFRQLQMLKIWNCKKLERLCFGGNLKLPHLKSLRLVNCPMLQPSIFQLQPSVDLCVEQLEELVIEDCNELTSLITYENLEEEAVVVDQQKSYSSPLFQKLKSLQIRTCGKLEMVLPLFSAGDLPLLEDLDIQDCEELKYIFGEYRDVGQVLQQESMLPSLTTVDLYGVASFINVFQKYNRRAPQVSKEDSMERYEKPKTSAFSWALRCCFKAPTNATLENQTISQRPQELSERIEIFNTADCLMRQPLKLQNIREMRFYGCPKLKSLFSISIATTMIMLEELEIRVCEELKHIITNEEEDDDHLNCNSIFPKLHSLTVNYCDKLEFIFPSTLSGALPKLKSIDIDGANELKYIFGRYIDLPALESLSLNGIGLDAVVTPKEPSASSERIESFIMRQPLSLRNIKRMRLDECSKLKSLFSISIATTIIMLEELKIWRCEELKHIITNEEDDDDHLNCNSIFPKLHSLKVKHCNKLEFIFPSTLSGGLPKLKSIYIGGAYELKYIFGRNIDLPALESLSLYEIPTMISIAMETTKTSKNLMKMTKDVQKLTKLSLTDSNIEEVLNLEGVEVKGPIMTLSLEKMWLKNLSELRHICKGPKYILSLPNLQALYIIACKKLRSIFSVSIVRSLPQLSKLIIEGCDELVEIIEESGDDHSHQLCFSKLEEIDIKGCNSLKYLFSISTPHMFPELKVLGIGEASELEQVFIHKQDDMHRIMKMEEVFPKLSDVTLSKLPRLITICEGIDLRNLEKCKVKDCPKFHQEMSPIQRGPKNEDLENQAATIASLDFAESSQEATKRSVEEVASSMNYEATEKEVDSRAVPDPASELVATTSSTFQSSEETVREVQVKDLILTSEKQASDTSVAKSQLRGASLHELEDENKDLAGTKTNIEASHQINIPFEDENVTSSTVSQVGGSQPAPSTSVASMKETHEQGSHEDDATDEATKPIQSTDLESRKQTRVSSIISLKEEKESVRIHASQASKAPTCTNSEITGQIIKDTMEDDALTAVESTNSDSKKQSTRPIDNLSRKDSAPNAAEEKAKGMDEKAAATNTSPIATSSVRTLTIEEIREHSSVREEVESNKPIKLNLPQVIPSPHHQSLIADDVEKVVGSTNFGSRKQYIRSIHNLTRNDSALSANEKAKGIDEKASATDKSPTATPFIRETNVKETESKKSMEGSLQVIPSLYHHQSQIADTGSSPPKLGICEIFQLVELKHGETALLAQALDRYPQLLLPREHLTPRITALSYRVLVDILVMLATKTPYTITPSEKSVLVANLNEAIVLGFDKEWVDSVRAKVFVVDMSDVSAAKEEIQVMEVKLGELDSQLKGLSEDRKELIEKMSMFKDIVSAKDKPFGI